MESQGGCRQKYQENDTDDRTETLLLHQIPKEENDDAQDGNREGLQAEIRHALLLKPASPGGREPRALGNHDEEAQPAQNRLLSRSARRHALTQPSKARDFSVNGELISSALENQLRSSRYYLLPR